MAAVIIIRSIILETLPEVFSFTSASTQLIWPVFSISLGIFSLVSYAEEAQNRLKLESITDPLTGLFIT